MTTRDREAEVRRLRAAMYEAQRATEASGFGNAECTAYDDAKTEYIIASLVAEMVLHPLPLTEAEQAKEAMGRG